MVSPECSFCYGSDKTTALLCYYVRMYACMLGMYGQLGHGNTDKQSSPKMVEALADQVVYLLACGNFHTVSYRDASCTYVYGHTYVCTCRRIILFCHSYVGCGDYRSTCFLLGKEFQQTCKKKLEYVACCSVDMQGSLYSTYCIIRS